MAPPREEWFENVLALVPPDPAGLMTRDRFDDIVLGSLEDMREDYYHAVKKAIVQYALVDASERRRLNLEALDGLLPAPGDIKTPHGELPEAWRENVDAAREDIAWTLQTLSPHALELSRLWSEDFARARRWRDDGRANRIVAYGPRVRAGRVRGPPDRHQRQRQGVAVQHLDVAVGGDFPTAPARVHQRRLGRVLSRRRRAAVQSTSRPRPRYPRRLRRLLRRQGVLGRALHVRSPGGASVVGGDARVSRAIGAERQSPRGDVSPAARIRRRERHRRARRVLVRHLGHPARGGGPRDGEILGLDTHGGSARTRRARREDQGSGRDDEPSSRRDRSPNSSIRTWNSSRWTSKRTSRRSRPRRRS